MLQRLTLGMASWDKSTVTLGAFAPQAYQNERLLGMCSGCTCVQQHEAGNRRLILAPGALLQRPTRLSVQVADARNAAVPAETLEAQYQCATAYVSLLRLPMNPSQQALDSPIEVVIYETTSHPKYYFLCFISSRYLFRRTIAFLRSPPSTLTPLLSSHMPSCTFMIATLPLVPLTG